MLFDENACCCGQNDEDKACNCSEDENCNCGDQEGCSCGHDHNHDEGESTIVMTDAETGQEYTFVIADDFIFEDSHYCVLLTTDEEEPEMVITKVVETDDGEGLMSLSEEDYDRVYAEYERLCEEEDYEDEDVEDEE